MRERERAHEEEDAERGVARRGRVGCCKCDAPAVCFSTESTAV